MKQEEKLMPISQLVLWLAVLTAIILICNLMFNNDDEKKKEYLERIEQVPEKNKVAAKNPVIIGETDDGQIIKMFEVENVERDCETCKPIIRKHYVYMVGKTTSDNTVVYANKSSHIETKVTIKE